MQVLKLAKKYVIDSQLFVSFSATLLGLFFLTEITTAAVFVLFFTYLNGYLYTKFQQSTFLHFILCLNVVFAVFISAVLLQNYPFPVFLKWLLVVLLGFLYNSKFLNVFIRKIPLLKIFYVGFVWALTSTWIFEAEVNSSHFFAVFLFISALVLPFDIRDMYNDRIVTFPRIIGVKKTKILAACLLLASCVPVISAETEMRSSFVASVIISMIAVWKSSPEKPDHFFSFWVESCTALPFFFLVLLKYF